MTHGPVNTHTHTTRCAYCCGHMMELRLPHSMCVCMRGVCVCVRVCVLPGCEAELEGYKVLHRGLVRQILTHIPYLHLQVTENTHTHTYTRTHTHTHTHGELCT